MAQSNRSFFGRVCRVGRFCRGRLFFLGRVLLFANLALGSSILCAWSRAWACAFFCRTRNADYALVPSPCSRKYEESSDADRRTGEGRPACISRLATGVLQGAAHEKRSG